MRVFLLSLVLCVAVVGCESTRKRDADRRASMDEYTYSYELKPDSLGLKQMAPSDKRMLRDLEEEGWVPVREERSTQGDVETVTIYYERK